MYRVLLVDDNGPLLRSLTVALSAAGYAIEPVSSSADAASRFEETAIDLVVTDLSMPGEEGLGLIRDLRKAAPTVPIVAMSGGSADPGRDLLGEAVAAGANASLRKPFSLAILRQAVRDLLPPKPDGAGV